MSRPSSHFGNMHFVNETKFSRKKVIIVFLILFLLFAGALAIRIVQPGFMGVSVRLGMAMDEPLDEGIHFVIPFVTQVYAVDTRIQKAEITSEAASKDLQTVSASVVINHHLEKQNVVTLYRQIGLKYAEVVITPGVQEVYKAACANFTAEALITERQKVSEIIRKGLQERLVDYGIIVDQVNVVSFNFSDEFNRAIESKVTAEQEALKAQNQLKRIEVEAQQAKTKAEGEANAVIEKAKADAESLKMRLEETGNYFTGRGAKMGRQTADHNSEWAGAWRTGRNSHFQSEW